MKTLKAIFFDVDGTIVDTEKDGHRVAFNEAFKQFGINADWSVQKYHKLLQVAGGKERMKSFFLEEGMDLLPKGKTLDECIPQLHLSKTEIFVSLIENRRLPLRPGIKRIMQQANERDIKIGICTTSNEKAAKAILSSLLSEIKIDFILAGDVVRNKKPDPEIYYLALQKAGVSNREALVVEDSENGVLAAKAAGLKTIVTVNEYTRNENLSQADVVISSFGNDHEITQILDGKITLSSKQQVDIDDLIGIL